MLFLPPGLPAISLLRKANYSVKSYNEEANNPNFSNKVLRILFLNLMPQKELAELDLARSLAFKEYDVQLFPIKIAGQTYKTTSQQHMDAFYHNFHELSHLTFDALIINGAPLEHLPFEDVRYWTELKEIMDWANTHTSCSLFICWAAQAALFHFYGINKFALKTKMFGVFTQDDIIPSPMTKGLETGFIMPHSRHTTVRKQDLLQQNLKVTAYGKECGVSVVEDSDKHRVFVMGHLEYEPYRLDKEYKRDLSKNLPIAPPVHYYMNNDPQQAVLYSWESSAKQFFENWLNYCQTCSQLSKNTPSYGL